MRLHSTVLPLALSAVMVARSAAQGPWRVDPRPTLDLSSTAADGTVLFARVSGATRLADGTIVIADADDRALHYFDPAGKPLRTAGRTGSGPGEFRHISWFGRCGPDSLHVWDMLQQRMSVFGANGAFVRQYEIRADTGRASTPFMTLACSPRGVIVYQLQPSRPESFVRPKDPAHPTREERVMASSAAVVIGNTAGQVTRLLGKHPSGSMYLMGGGGFPLPLAPATYLAVAGERVYVGTADSTASIAGYAPDGTRRLLKLALPSRKTTTVQRERAAAAVASLAPPSLRQLAEDSLKLAPMPAMAPPYCALFGDVDGVLWVQLTVLGDPDTRLRAISAEEKMLGEITLPANVVVHEIGRDYVLASFDDADDIPHLALFRLHRGH